MTPSDSAPIAALTEGFTFAYLKEAFVATLFYLFQQREAALANGPTPTNSDSSTSPSNDSPSAFRHAFETQVTMLKEQMADEEKSEEGKKEKKTEGDEEGEKPCVC